jgi:hypothetical protein
MTHNPYARALRDPITLTNGRVVVFTMAPNGSQDATMQDGGTMSYSEFDELDRAIKHPVFHSWLIRDPQQTD